MAGAGGAGGGDEGGAEGVDARWQIPYGPMNLKVVRGAARVFGAARPSASGPGGGNVV